MSHAIPSHNNSMNERNERRHNWKTEMRRANGGKQELSAEQATAKFEKLANALVVSGAVDQTSDNAFRVRVGTGNKFYPVYRIQGAFKCECKDFDNYNDCGHAQAAELFAARLEAEAEMNQIEAAKEFTATLRYGNRKGLDFEKQKSFADRRAACEWLVTESFNKFQPEGEVRDAFGSIVFEIENEFFELWAEA